MMFPFTFSTKFFTRLSGRWRVIKLHSSWQRQVSVLAEDTSVLSAVARTSLKNPREHTLSHVGMWYTVDPDIVNRLFLKCGLTKQYEELTKTLAETSLMVREPAITIMDYIKRSNLNQIPNKYILYGRQGTGKTLTIAHLMHYLYEDEWVILHLHCPSNWCRLFKEIVPSTTREGFYDHTVDASVYLQHFMSQNGELIEKLQLKATKDYHWSIRESTAKGSSLASVAEFGIQRARYASDVVYAINSELKQYAKEGRCKVCLVCDGINTFFHPVSFFVTDDKTVVPPKKFTLFQAFWQMFDADWNNGCIIASVNFEMSTKDRRKSYLPRYLLRKEGWDTLDPFIPVLVPNYTPMEVTSVINYYIDTKWLQHPAAGTQNGREELYFMSGLHPAELVKLINCH